jgi:hypothetical protein
MRISQSALQVLRIGLTDVFQAVCLNQLHNALKTCSNVQRERIQRRSHLLVQEFNAPYHPVSIPFLQCSQQYRFTSPSCLKPDHYGFRFQVDAPDFFYAVLYLIFQGEDLGG